MLAIFAIYFSGMSYASVSILNCVVLFSSSFTKKIKLSKQQLNNPGVGWGGEVGVAYIPALAQEGLLSYELGSSSDVTKL